MDAEAPGRREACSTQLPDARLPHTLTPDETKRHRLSDRRRTRRPGLLTLRGAELLGRADVVVSDARVNPELLRRAPASAEIICEGKPAAEPALPPAELNQLLIARARAGKTVVRLIGGDPYLFGSGAAEAEQLAGAGIPFEVVPGVSSSLGLSGGPSSGNASS